MQGKGSFFSLSLPYCEVYYKTYTSIVCLFSYKKAPNLRNGAETYMLLQFTNYRFHFRQFHFLQLLQFYPL